jgi:hypothetical protein
MNQTPNESSNTFAITASQSTTSHHPGPRHSWSQDLLPSIISRHSLALSSIPLKSTIMSGSSPKCYLAISCSPWDGVFASQNPSCASPTKENDFYHGRFLWYIEETFFIATDAFSMKSKTRLKSHGRMVYDGPPIFMVFSKSTTEWQLLLMWFGRPQRDDVITKLTMM